MYKSKVKMPKEIKNKCNIAIHSATVAAGTAGASPIPISDAVVITGVQIAMIVSLGKVFGISLSESAAKSLASVTVTQQAGRAIFSNLLKAIPVAGTLIGPFLGATTAGVLTEALGWIIADDFFRISQGEEPENIVEAAGELQSAFDGLRMQKN